MKKDIIKLPNANITYHKSELEDIYFNKNKKYLIAFKTVYELGYSENAGYSCKKMHYLDDRQGWTSRGRHEFVTAKRLNEVFKFYGYHREVVE